MSDELDLNKHEQILSFYRLLTEKDRRILYIFTQGLDLNDIDLQIEQNSAILEKFRHRIPTLNDMINVSNEFRGHLQSNPNDSFINIGYTPLITGPKSEKYITLKKQFRQKVNLYRKWITKFADIVNESHEHNQISQPNVDAWQYNTSEKVSAALSNLWFIRKVILFGSVARGDENENSDIDLAIEIPFVLEKAGKTVLHYLLNIVNETIEPYQKKLENPLKSEENLINIILLTCASKTTLKAFQTGEYFKSAKVLFERQSEYSFTPPAQGFKIDTEKIFACIIPRDYEEESYWMLNDGEKTFDEIDSRPFTVIKTIKNRFIYAAKFNFPNGYIYRNSGRHLFKIIDQTETVNKTKEMHAICTSNFLFFIKILKISNE